MHWLPTIIIAWVVAGFINYGATFAYFDQEHPYLRTHPDRSQVLSSRATGFAIGGLISFPVVLILSGFYEHGLQYSMENKPT